jgi:Spy/CpxP family protein refolding chaperone
MTHCLPVRGLSTLSALILLTAGCAASPAAAPDTKGLPGPAYTTLQAQPSAQQPPDVTEIFSFLKGIGLTATQKTQIMGLLQQQRPVVSQEEAQKRSERFLSLMAMQTIPTTALSAYFQQSQDASRKETAASVELFAKMRALLTPAQRARVVANIRKAATEAEQSAQSTETTETQQQQDTQDTQDQPPDLALTEAQQRAFAALTPVQASAENRPDPLLTFFEKGDKQALLTSLLGPTTSADQVKKLVTAYAGLTHTQRMKLVNYSRQQQQQRQQQQEQSSQGEEET